MQSDKRFDDNEWLDADEREPEPDPGRPGTIWPDGSVLPYRDQRARIGLSRWPLTAFCGNSGTCTRPDMRFLDGHGTTTTP